MQDQELLIRDKYNGDSTIDLTDDLTRLALGEPLAYVIGWIPFLGLRIDLSSHPLIPRPETEWWTEELLAHLVERFGKRPFTLLDLCAGSGAIGLSVLKAFPHAQVHFGEKIPEHIALIQKNIVLNDLDGSRTTIKESDLFESFSTDHFDVIVTNPPYIPEARSLDTSVTSFEPAEALYAGSDGLDLIRRIAIDTPQRMNPSGEMWVECDIDNIEEAKKLLLAHDALRADIRTDLYGRPRIVVGYYA